MCTESARCSTARGVGGCCLTKAPDRQERGWLQSHAETTQHAPHRVIHVSLYYEVGILLPRHVWRGPTKGSCRGGWGVDAGGEKRECRAATRLEVSRSTSSRNAAHGYNGTLLWVVATMCRGTTAPRRARGV